jgi:putative transposase
MELMFPSRRSIRLHGHDYASSGAYFVTVCAAERKCIFATMHDTVVQLTMPGQIVEESWHWLAHRYPFVHLDEHILMPNHLHAIVWLEDGCLKPLGSLIGAFKTVSSRRIKELFGTPDQIWQRSYHEHIVRSDRSLLALRQYIHDNPAQWALDNENPENTADGSSKRTDKGYTLPDTRSVSVL